MRADAEVTQQFGPNRWAFRGGNVVGDVVPNRSVDIVGGALQRGGGILEAVAHSEARLG